MLDLQSQFQAIVVAIEAAGVDPSVDSPVDLSMEPRLRAYQTEAYRWLRLLSVLDAIENSESARDDFSGAIAT